jgi:transposase
VSRGTVTRWRARFLAGRLDALHDEPRPGVPRTITDAQVEEIVVRTLEQVPPGATHWSKRELARQAGISPSSVLRIWRAFGLQPWRAETFKISPDPLLIDKIRDVAGLYLAPPANAVVFSVDEKPHIQALQRTAPVLPMLPGVPERRSFDYERHGTIDLLAATDTAAGKVIGRVSAQPRAVDFRDFPGEIDRQAGTGRAVQVICDNLSAHKAPTVQRRLLSRPRLAALHPGLLLLDQPGRAVVRRIAAAMPGTWRVLLARRAHDRPRRLDQALERSRPALHLDQDRRPNYRPHLPLLLTHLRTGSLARDGQRPPVQLQGRLDRRQTICAPKLASWRRPCGSRSPRAPGGRRHLPQRLRMPARQRWHHRPRLCEWHQAASLQEGQGGPMRSVAESSFASVRRDRINDRVCPKRSCQLPESIINFGKLSSKADQPKACLSTEVLGSKSDPGEPIDHNPITAQPPLSR